MGDERRGAAISEVHVAELRKGASMTPLADALGALVEEGGASDALRSTWTVTRAWMSVNGDYERRHTVGTFVDAGRAGAAPTLVVYVDSKSCEVDLMANREVYLARMASCGLRFSKVVFRRSKDEYIRRRDDRLARGDAPEEAPRPEPPALDAAEERHIEELCAALPEGLRDSVSRAMRVSYQARKQEDS